jgi:hypothetical protein
MADLSGDDAGRGQLLLVTGFAIAVAIVALVLLLNTAIYTENLATRSVDTGESDALAYRDAVERSLWPAVSGVNEGDDVTRTERVRNASARVDRVAKLNARRHLLEGTAATVTNRTYHDGTRLTQTDANRTVTPAAGSSVDWKVATNVDDVRAVELNVTGGLESTTNPAEAFSLAVSNDTGDEWRVHVYDDSGAAVDVTYPNGTTTGVCSGQFSGPPVMNLSAGTINGSTCSPLAFEEHLMPPYDTVIVRYGNRSTATYEMTVNTTVGTTGFDDSPSVTTPYEVPVVYSMHADVVYESAELAYRARIYAGPEADE